MTKLADILRSPAMVFYEYSVDDGKLPRQAADALDAAERALERAKHFIVNGVALGFIRMPDADTPDPAHETLPAVNAALAKLRGEA